MASSGGAAASKKGYQEALNQFNALREEQRQMGMKINQVEMEAREHTLVIDVLKKVPSERRCYRMVGSALVDRTAGDVLPTLEGNRDQMLALVEQMKTKLADKGRELNDFKEKHGIRLASEQGRPSQADDADQSKGDKASDGGGGGVLVA